MSKIKNIAGAIHVARKVYQNKEKIKGIVGNKGSARGDVFDKVEDGAGVISRMIKAITTGKYRLPIKTVLYVIGGVLYFISPIDFIPDFFLGIGFLDDITVIALVIRKAMKEIDKFKFWESSQTVQAGIIKIS